VLEIAIGVSLVAMLVGHIWLIVLGTRTKGMSTGVWFALVGFAALVWGFANWRNQNEEVRTLVPATMMSGGMLLLILSVIASSG
jgi:hypothetical protein